MYHAFRHGLRMAVGSALLVGAGLAQAATVYTYSEDFGGGVGAEWSTPTPNWFLGVDTTPSGNDFLGLADANSANGLFAGAVQLTLTGLPSYTGFSVSFDIYVIRSWDGNDFLNGPDLFTASFNNSKFSTSIVHTTFSNGAAKQSYPGNFLVDNPAGSGANAINSLGYTGSGGINDAVYKIGTAWGGLAATTDAVLTLAAFGLDGESWGIDNFTISFNNDAVGGGGGNPVPVPPAIALMAGALALLVVRRRPAR